MITMQIKSEGQCSGICFSKEPSFLFFLLTRISVLLTQQDESPGAHAQPPHILSVLFEGGQGSMF